MPAVDKAEIRREMAAIRKVLWEDWDPIGVNDEPAVSDEYDAYAGRIHTLLQNGVTDVEMIAHLRGIETDRMGLHGQTDEQLAVVAAKLRACVGNLSSDSDRNFHRRIVFPLPSADS